MGTSVTLACFAAGARIATPRGDVRVEELRVGDFVLVSANAARHEAPIVWIGRRWIDCASRPTPRSVWPVRIAAHAFGPGKPRRALHLSPDHAVFLHGVLIPVRYLVDDGNVTQVPMNEVDYWHVELPNHDVILAEGLAVESYLATGDADAASIWEARGFAPLTVRGPQVEAARELVAARH
jgi:Hint domain